MASSRQPLSKFRRCTGDALFVIGSVSIAMALVPQAPMSAGLSFGLGVLLIALSHVFYPFQDQLARVRGVPIADPSHELKLPDDSSSRKDAI
jgi:hypothetical protein